MNQRLEFLLNRAIPFNADKLKILDQITQCLSSSNPTEINIATQVWGQIRQDPQFINDCPFILENSNYHFTKFLTLVVLQEAIKSKWLSLPLEQREGFKGYIIKIVINYGKQPNLDKSLESILSKANSILVQIVKYQWNSTWTTFIPDICQTSKTDPNMCENCFSILRMLSQQIFDFSKNQMTKQQISELKSKMYQQFTQIFELCQLILDNSQKCKNSLIRACLDTLDVFLEWIPSYYIYFSDIIVKLISFLSNDFLRNSALKCLIEIGALKIQNGQEKIGEIKNKIFIMLDETINKINSIIPISEDIIAIKRLKPKSQIQQFQMLCQDIAMFFTSLLKQQYVWLIQENSSNEMISMVIKKSLMYLVKLLRLPDQQTYKIIVEFFHFLTKQVTQQKAKNIKPLLYGSRDIITDIYIEVFNEVTNIIVLRMAKPQEVLIVIDETGMPVREQLVNTENNSWYELMKELLINLAQYNWPATKQYIQSKIQKQNSHQFNFDLLNSLSWAVGSLNGFIPENEEKTFLIAVIRNLLQLCQNKKGKQNKAVVASCIMYVVGQYPTFLKGNWSFLKVVVRKQFEFMKQSFPGVMEMACNTFLKIAISTKQQFVHCQQNEQQPYIFELIRRIPEQTKQLNQDSLKLIFFQAVGHIISAEPSLETKSVLMKNTLGIHYQQFLNIIAGAQTNPQILKQEEVERKIMYFIKINERLAFSVGLPYGSLFIQINSSLNNIYLYYANQINKNVQQQGKNVLNYVTVKRKRIINKQIIKLYNTYITKSQIRFPAEVQSIIASFVEPLNMLLEDFAKSTEDTKQAQFLNLLTTIFEKLSVGLKPTFVTYVLELVLNSTLSLITTDFNSFPEIRMAFFYFLKSIIKFNFEQLYNLAQDQFSTILNCVVWLFKHQLNTYCDMGLQLLTQTLINVNKNKLIIDIFYSKYYLTLLKDLLEVLTDGFHKSGFRNQSRIFFMLIQAVTSNLITTDLSNMTFNSNADFVFNHLLQILSGAFPNVSKIDTSNKLKNMFLMKDEKEFRHEVSDYLIMINRYTLLEQEIVNS